jgi:phenol hydroxylase P0 protein
MDPRRKYVRVIGHRPGRDGVDFVEFELAIGDPDVYVELILPREAFAAFCDENQVTLLDGPREPAGDLDFGLHHLAQKIGGPR